MFTNANLAKVKAKGRGTLVLYFALVPSPRAVSVLLLAVRYPGTITSAAGKPNPKLTAAFITLARKAALSIR